MATLSGSTSSSLAAHANACLAKAVPIPGWPLWTMGKAALGSQSDFDLLQNAVDYLTCKAKAKMPFTDDEKAFLKRLFECLWWGGELKRYPEAAELADHYVNGGGAKLTIDAAVYQTSIVVKDTSEAIKDYICHLAGRHISFATVRSSDPGFLHSSQARPVSWAAGRDVQRQGYVLKDGNLLTEQDNSRLKNTNNRFILAAQNMKLTEKVGFTRWSVDDPYTFQPFEKSNFYTNIPLSSSQVLKLPDGLSQYMTVLGIADEFAYTAEWAEIWNF